MKARVTPARPRVPDLPAPTRGGRFADLVLGRGSLEPAVRGARIAAILYLCGGVVVLATCWSAPAAGRVWLWAAGAAAVAVGLLVPLLPWARWRPESTMVLPVLALGLTAFGGKMSGAVLEYLAVYALIFATVGLIHPPGWSVRVAPLAAASMVGAGTPLRITLVSMPVWMAVGEVVAQTSSRQQRAELSIERLLGATTSLSRARGIGEAVALVTELSRELLGADRVSVFLGEGEPSPRLVEWPVTDGRAERGQLIIDLEGAEDPMARALSERTVVFVPDAAHPGGSRLAARVLGARAAVLSPLAGDKGAYGMVVAVWDRPIRRLDPHLDRASRLLAGEAGRVLERLRVAADLTRQVETDPLTGLANRRSYERALAALRPGDALVLIDLDNFKAINDRLGHPAGDAALLALAGCLKAAARRQDCVARFGGEEFALVLAEAGEAGALRAVEAVRSLWNREGSPTTFSAGVAVAAYGEEPRSVETRADAALYRAKQEGRDRVRVAPAGEPPA